MPVGVTVTTAVVTPVFQEYVPPPVAVRVAGCPVQIVTFDPAFAFGNALTVTVAGSVSVQPFPSVTVSVYVVGVVGDALGLAQFVQLNPVEGAQL